MAAKKTNSLQVNSDTLAEFFRNQAQSRLPETSNIGIGGDGIPSITGGRQTISQEKDKYLANIDWSKRTPLQNYLEFGSRGLTGSGKEIGREEQKKAIERMKQFAGGKKVEIPVEEDISTATVKEPEKQSAQKLYRVMYAGKGAEASEIYETKEEADAALKKAGGKGAIAGINMSQKTRGGEMLPTEDVQARKQRYMDQLSKTKEISKSESDRLKKIQALRNPQTEEEILQVAENRGRMEDALTEANKAKRAEDKKAGAGFESWRSDVKARRESEGMLNNYNKQLGLLNRAYLQAKQADDPLAAYQIQEYIQEYKSGVPKEMGARKKFAESGALQERNEMLRKKMEEARKQAEKERQLARVNPDYNR